MKILLLSALFFAFINAHAQQQTMRIKLYFPNSKIDKPDCPVPVHPAIRTVTKTNAVAKVALESTRTLRIYSVEFKSRPPLYRNN